MRIITPICKDYMIFKQITMLSTWHKVGPQQIIVIALNPDPRCCWKSFRILTNDFLLKGCASRENQIEVREGSAKSVWNLPNCHLLQCGNGKDRKETDKLRYMDSTDDNSLWKTRAWGMAGASSPSATGVFWHLINTVNSCIQEFKSLPSMLCLKEMSEAFILCWEG